MTDYTPKWHRELSIFSRIKPLIMLEGNIYDSYQYPAEGSVPKGSILRLTDYLHYFFKDMGYEVISFYDSLRGFTNTCEEGYLQAFSELTGAKTADGAIPAAFKGSTAGSAVQLVRSALSQNKKPCAIVMNCASRYIVSPDHLQQSEVDSYTTLLQASMEAAEVKTQGGKLRNLLVLIVNKSNDIPAWFYLDNPNEKTITITTPTKEERSGFVCGGNFATFFAGDIYSGEMPYYTEHPAELAKIQERFAALTEGFSFTEMNGLRKLCKNERVSVRNMCDVIDLYKYGIKDNPWRSLDVNSLRSAGEDFRRRVKGQDYALTKTLDVVKRAVTGMSGLQGSSHTRPKGVLFFAGPTGTGKTETAKTLAERLFGDERCCIRFDMSEYSQSHSDQKLLGAPPGYVGYEAGGQLTNAVRNNPFSILLFDEIEKAHPSVMDKFLQILEDGRMTDGQGNTVYFSECVIIFTSNLGIYTRTRDGGRVPNVNPEMPYHEVQQRVRSAIEDYFKLELGRPEILNRIGENIVVFDFIRPDSAKQILRSQVDRILANLSADRQINVTLSDNAYSVLQEKALGNLSNGGRGIGNIVENLLINPLSRYLFDNGIFSDAALEITAIQPELMPPEINCVRK
ncbi:MAG: AAA family ATPase [Oscillospiraceae bacterium]